MPVQYRKKREKERRERDIMDAAERPFIEKGFEGTSMDDRHLAEAKARKTANVSGTIVTYCPFCYLSLSTIDPGNVKDIYVLLSEHFSAAGSMTTNRAPFV